MTEYNYDLNRTTRKPYVDPKTTAVYRGIYVDVLTNLIYAVDTSGPRVVVLELTATEIKFKREISLDVRLKNKLNGIFYKSNKLYLALNNNTIDVRNDNGVSITQFKSVCPTSMDIWMIFGDFGNDNLLLIPCYADKIAVVYTLDGEHTGVAYKTIGNAIACTFITNKLICTTHGPNSLELFLHPDVNKKGE